MSLSAADAESHLLRLVDEEAELLRDSIDCETFQDDGTLTAIARYNAVVSGGGTSDLQSRIAFEYTRRLMHELDLFRPTAEDFMRSALAVPSCGVEGWLTTNDSCQSQVPADAFSVSNNCARLLSSHVAGQTITENVFGLCTEALRTVASGPYSDPTCTTEIREDIAQFATALREKAINTNATSVAGSSAREPSREIGK